MKELIYQAILENLEIVNVACGGGDDTAIAIKQTHEDYFQDEKDKEREARLLTDIIANKIGI